MCIRDRFEATRYHSLIVQEPTPEALEVTAFTKDGELMGVCLLYTSDAADERSSVDLGGRRIIKKKKKGE